MSASNSGVEPVETPTGKPRRQRGVIESLLSIALGMEAGVLLFVTIYLFGARVLEPAVAWSAGGAAILVVGLLAGLQRYGWAVVAGGAAQLGLIALGFLAPAMFVLGAVFGAIWLWCFLKARSIERMRAAASASVE